MVSPFESSTLELEAGEGHGVPGLGIGLDDLDAAVERLVDDG